MFFGEAEKYGFYVVRCNLFATSRALELVRLLFKWINQTTSPVRTCLIGFAYNYARALGIKDIFLIPAGINN